MEEEREYVRVGVEEPSQLECLQEVEKFRSSEVQTFHVDPGDPDVALSRSSETLIHYSGPTPATSKQAKRY
jgi:hypothetical protein